MEIIKTYPTVLQDHIRSFYTVKAKDVSSLLKQGDLRGQHRLPDGTLDLVFNLGDPVEISRNGGAFQEMPTAAVTGLYPDSSLVRYLGRVHLVGAVLLPGSAHLFIREVLTQFRAATIDASLIFGGNVTLLLEQLHEVQAEPEKHRLVEGFLNGYLRGNREQDTFDRIGAAIRQVHRYHGAIDMRVLRAHCCMSERNFRRKFNEYVGMGPKQYAGIVRIKELMKRYEPSKSNYLELLTDSGYTDHAHFNKDFQRVVGMGPNTYFKTQAAVDKAFIDLI
ncbi:AraC-like DNA-binding protein [Mucilaginibacter gracilis]|uniref:AraC-like DNA-binding protein n=1 Tax=Mucilaginibacter gracilis TaxID=423350 RepID=A0A495J006_9SPHI|nr:AraC family transcriptional regulator [Mucilaginibacter gracilis]RKR82062.1 AraC-like DNA-binding protein [Mucilaginibacter gracilis]